MFLFCITRVSSLICFEVTYVIQNLTGSSWDEGINSGKIKQKLLNWSTRLAYNRLGFLYNTAFCNSIAIFSLTPWKKSTGTASSQCSTFTQCSYSSSTTPGTAKLHIAQASWHKAGTCSLRVGLPLCCHSGK